MKIGIIGEQGAGKTTLFKTLIPVRTQTKTKQNAEISRPNSGNLVVDDKRLEFIASLLKPEKITNPFIELIDPPGFTKSTYSFIRQTSVLIYIIPFFRKSHSPIKSLETLISEINRSDLEILDNALPKVKSENEKNLLNKCKELLVSNTDEPGPLAKTSINYDLENIREEDEKFLRGFGFLSQKPPFVILNVNYSSSADVETNNVTLQEVIDFTTNNKLPFLCINAKLEQELLALPLEEQEIYRQEFGALGTYYYTSSLFKELMYKTLRIITFFTVVGTEARAWQLKEGTRIVQAAGLIHSDMERGFIKADVIKYEDFKTCQSFKLAREKGLLRNVNREYIVQDGDILEFKFNV